jgi:ribonucleoside-diphosphate reductase alpha chain
MTPYSTYIAKSRYSRFINTENRREHWNETVDRYFNFLFNHLEKNYKWSPNNDLRLELISAVKNLEVMPSMRAIMTPKRLMRLCIFYYAVLG